MLPPWTADADHFTVDDDQYHTADGWHRHRGGGGDGVKRHEQYVCRADDMLVMEIIKVFLDKI